jgi:hypothetical protein
MIEPENENAVPESKDGSDAPEADGATGSTPDEMEHPDARQELAEGGDRADSISGARPNGIVAETQSGTANEHHAPPAIEPGGKHASVSPRQAHDRSGERLMSGIISRIERLENWVKTNRLN